MAVGGRGDLGDGLTVRDLRCEKHDLDSELVLQTPLADIDVLLALSAENRLAELLGVLYDDRRILRGDLGESLAELGLIVLRLGLDGAAVLGCREHNVFE